jgi:hypothetical protein
MAVAGLRVSNGFADLEALYRHLDSINLLDDERLRPGWDLYFMVSLSCGSIREVWALDRHSFSLNGFAGLTCLITSLTRSHTFSHARSRSLTLTPRHSHPSPRTGATA